MFRAFHYKKILKLFFVVLVFLFSFSQTLVAAPLVSDSLFSTGTGFNGTVRNPIYIESENAYLVIGDFTTYNSASINGLAKINATTGVLDTTFQTNIGTGAIGGVNSAVQQADGKFIIAGSFTSFNGTSANRIARINADGTLDTTFATTIGTGANSGAFGVALQSDGKIILLGSFSLFNGTTATRIVRLNTDGTIDTTFTTNASAAITSGLLHLYNATELADGKIIVSGNGSGLGAIARLNADGTLDTTFNSGGTGFNGGIWEHRVLPNGKILCAGNFTTYNSLPVSNRIARLNADGSNDSTFNSGGSGLDNVALSIYQIPGGPILVGGIFGTYDSNPVGNIIAINDDGSYPALDFGTGFAGQSHFDAFHYRTNGNLLIVGNFVLYNSISANRIVKFDLTAPVISSVSITSNNTNNSYAKVGDTVTLFWTSDDAPSSQTVIIGGQLVTPTCTQTSVASCSATLPITALTPSSDGTLSFSISTTSSGGTTGPVTTTNNSSSVTIDRSVAAPTFTNPLNGAYTTNPTAITGACEAGATVTLTSTGITSSPTTAVCSGGNTFTFPSITFTSSSPTNVSITQTDLAGNTSSLTTEVFSYTANPIGGPGSQNGAVLLFDDLQKSSGVVKQEPVLRTYISPIDGSVLPCSPFNQYYKFGEQNERSEVRIWQAFLNKTLKTNLTLDGIYGRRTTKATKVFQKKYASEILIPWGITTPTGYTYKTTRAKGNQLLGCSEGPLVLKNGATVEIK